MCNFVHSLYYPGSGTNGTLVCVLLPGVPIQANGWLLTGELVNGNPHTMLTINRKYLLEMGYLFKSSVNFLLWDLPFSHPPSFAARNGRENVFRLYDSFTSNIWVNICRHAFIVYVNGVFGQIRSVTLDKYLWSFNKYSRLTIHSCHTIYRIYSLPVRFE